MEEGVAPTDSRLRPDQRMMEDALWDEANEEKVGLEVMLIGSILDFDPVLHFVNQSLI